MSLEKQAEYYRVKAAYIDMLVLKNSHLEKIKKIDENMEAQLKKIEELKTELNIRE